nr:hypothetical protein [uncultured Bacillus sp.]
MTNKNTFENEIVGKLLHSIRVKLETMPVRNSKIMKSFEVLEHLEGEIGRQHDRLAIEKLINFLSSIALAPIKQDLHQLKQHLSL